MKSKVSLINYTKDPIITMCFARRVMHSPVPDTLEELSSDPIKWLGMGIEEYVEKVLTKDGMPTFLEYVNFVFKVEGVSRALTHQLVRHRIGFSFSQQSMRCVDVPNFATKKDFVIPSTIKNKEKYFEKMEKIQELYREMLSEGESIQDARNILPTGIQTAITFSCSLRALIGMVNKRLCLKTQEEFREVAEQIIVEIKKIDPQLSAWFGKPCDFGKCMMQGENHMQFLENKLSGKQNTDHICPIYYEKFIKGAKKNE